MCITPVKLGHSLRKIQEAGCDVGDFTESLQELLRYNENASSGGKALEEFFYARKIPLDFLPIAKKELYGTLAEGIDIVQVEGAVALLNDLRKKYDLAIVSVGDSQQQRFKMKKAGIDTSIFYKIFLVEEGSKKKYYQLLKDELQLSPEDIVVCGDRVEGDLIPAKELGCVTVHMKWGRGRQGDGQASEIDFTITKLSQMQQILEKMNNKV